ncbi:MAG: sigma-70 family RNA polymerase sigma factor [Planctomycetales bacterium]|nr:sigma-70 family RNA polymerase sigma factor [Planctomycetales bacterium]
MKWSDVNHGEGTVSRTSSSLLRRAKANDADAWQQLVETYSRRVYRWCRQAGLQPADASNVVQEVLRSVARKLGDFRRERASDTFRGWLRRITQNKLRDHFRNQAKRVDRAMGGTDAHQMIVTVSESADAIAKPSGGSSADGDTESSVPALHQISNPVVARVRNEFSDRDWRFFWRVVVDGQSAVEVGNEFEVTANTVRLVKMRILRRLREEFANQAESTQSSSA